MLLIDRHVLGPDLTVGEADPVRRLGAREDHLSDPQLHRRVDDVVRAERVDPERLVVWSNQDRWDRGEVDDGVVVRYTGPGLEFVEARVRAQSVEDLSGIGQVDAEVGDARVSERRQVPVDHPVSLLDEMGDRVPTRLAAATRKEDSHDSDGTDPSVYHDDLVMSLHCASTDRFRTDASAQASGHQHVTAQDDRAAADALGRALGGG